MKSGRSNERLSGGKLFMLFLGVNLRCCCFNWQSILVVVVVVGMLLSGFLFDIFWAVSFFTLFLLCVIYFIRFMFFLYHLLLFFFYSLSL